MTNYLTNPTYLTAWANRGNPADIAYRETVCDALPHGCSRCHECGYKLRSVLDGEEWCEVCEQYRRYKTHGW